MQYNKAQVKIKEGKQPTQQSKATTTAPVKQTRVDSYISKGHAAKTVKEKADYARKALDKLLSS